jgi:hypothetical protein
MQNMILSYLECIKTMNVHSIFNIVVLLSSTVCTCMVTERNTRVVALIDSL